MDPERARRLERLYHSALEREERERAAFLKDACGADDGLRRELESLLVHDRDAGTFIEAPAIAVAARLMAEERDSSSQASGAAASRVGELEPGQILAQRFQIVRKLGEGGMGQVWLAEQLSPVRRQVALKLIKAGMYDAAVVQRFESERQSLAIMDHPAIAKVFEAGATEYGQPYFVMEYVDGLPITDYCDQKKLTIKQRLGLFIQACEGVQHAHQKAIIHRDLKPANILVMEVDGKPVPRIIDFGLAKAVTPRLEGESLFTHVGSLVGTPAYMSPEQADPNVQDIDTRTDVYSLGVVLYVLLAGSQPFDPKLWKNRPLEEVLRTLREKEPVRPSAKVSSDADGSAASATARGVERDQLVSLLRGDLDWITMKAVEKDRSRRYGTPLELAADLHRYLNHEPVAARPASVAYRMQKYVRRHRLGVAAAATLVLLLAGFGILQTVELRRITRERDRANQERDRATRITDFMTNMFKVSDPSEARGNTVTAREILDKASNDTGTLLATDPQVQAQMMAVMARTYHNLGLFARAYDLAKRAFDARLSLLGPDDPRTLESMTQLGWTLDRAGRFDEAEKLERQALADERRVLGEEDPLTIETTDHLAVILEDEGHNDEAEKLARQAIEQGNRKLGPENAQTLLAMNHLGRALWFQARYAEAEQEYRQLLDLDRRVLGPDHPQTLSAMNSLAVSYMAEHRNAEAEEMYREVLAVQQRVLGPEHQATALTLANLGVLLDNEGRVAEAEKVDREAVRVRTHALGPEHPETIDSEQNLAEVFVKEGHFQEAEKMQRATLAIQARVVGTEHPDFLRAQSNLAGILIFEGRYAEAEEMARKTLAVQVRTQGLLHSDSIDTRRQVAMAMAHTHRYSKAIDLFQEAITQEDRGEAQGNRWAIPYALACVAQAANRPHDALRYLQEAVEHGYNDPDGLLADDDLQGLHHNADFQELVAQLRHPPTMP